MDEDTLGKIGAALLVAGLIFTSGPLMLIAIVLIVISAFMYIFD